MTKKSSTIRADWVAKTLAGMILGCMVALGACALFMLLPLDIGMSAKAQLAMWLFAPIWLGILCCCYLFRSGAKAWLWLTRANLLIFLLLFLFKSTSA